MEAMEELIMGPKDQTHIVKGKRTKRQRPQSPIPFSIIRDGYGSNDDNPNFSPATSEDELLNRTTDEELEDMANCLILLARGHSRNSTIHKDKDDDHLQEPINNMDTYKFSSKRYIETSGTNGGKVGIYVYECKTCSRSFPSFQALGGHRASHKKPKAAATATATADDRKPLGLSDDDDNEPPVLYKNRESSSSLYDLQLSSKGLFGNTNSKFKVHECSICGAEFSSGQALGGHMRRHRGQPISTTNTTLSLSPSNTVVTDHEEAKKRKNGLSLDLNLPAPEDDYPRESKFGFASKQQKQESPMVLSTAPSLVDCHY